MCSTLCYKITGQVVGGVPQWEYDMINKDYACYSSADCGKSDYTGAQYCKDNNLYQLYKQYSCSSFTCSNSNSEQLIKNCANGCSNGACNTQPFDGTACPTEGDTVTYSGISYTCYNGYFKNTKELINLYRQGKPPAIFLLSRLSEVWSKFLIWLNNLGGAPPATFTSLCYQESANVATACGGLATGTYSKDVTYLYINYTKPAGFTSAIWQVKYGGLNTYNITTATANLLTCYSAYQNKLVLRIYSHNSPAAGLLTFPQCYDGTNWLDLNSRTTGATPPSWVQTSICGNQMFDGNWNNQCAYRTGSLAGWDTGTTGAGDINEEAIIWTK
jgi:hypothetical protein